MPKIQFGNKAIFNNVVCESTEYVAICVRVLIRSAIRCNRGGNPIPGKQQRAAFIRDFKGPIWHFEIALWAESPWTLSLCRGFFGKREMSSRSPPPAAVAAVLAASGRCVPGLRSCRNQGKSQKTGWQQEA